VNIAHNTITEQHTIKDAILGLNDALTKHGISTLFVINSESELVGTITDGDIRRALVAGSQLDTDISGVMHRNFSFLREHKFTLSDIDSIRDRKIDIVPVLDENNRIVRVVEFKKLKSVLPLTAVLIAGGEGRRLLPLTLTTPKPLLKIGNKPIIEHNIDRLVQHGVATIHISVNYLAQQIKDYFQDGASKGIRIGYVQESKPLGTIGSVSLLEEIDTDYVLISNSDLLTNINYEDMFRTFIDRDADLIVATNPYKVNIPYGILEVDSEDHIKGLIEKPTYEYYSNAGIYILKKSILELLPKNEYFNATDLIELLLRQNYKVLHYKILTYWLDIGLMDDYHKAQEDIKHISLY